MPANAAEATDAEVASWFSRSGPARRASSISRVDQAAALAQEYFCRPDDDEPVAKKPKTESFSFANEMLDKAPDNLQTCRSLQLFLEKKLKAEATPAPEVGGP